MSDDDPLCPKCGKPATRSSTRYGVRHDCCDLWSWGGAPLVDRVTHDARKAAHKHFDAVWQSGRVSRSRAYKMLAERLQLAPEQCHMKLMDAATAEKAIRVAQYLQHKFGIYQ